jgi:hypothetical protein
MIGGDAYVGPARQGPHMPSHRIASHRIASAEISALLPPSDHPQKENANATGEKTCSCTALDLHEINISKDSISHTVTFIHKMELLRGLQLLLH